MALQGYGWDSIGPLLGAGFSVVVKQNMGKRITLDSIILIGLFCKREISPGEMVIEYTGEEIRASLTDTRERYYESKVRY